jgi:hypothetical protein
MFVYTDDKTGDVWLLGAYFECDTCHKVYSYADGLKMDRRLVRLLPQNATAHYNLACSLALLKRKSDALRSLRHAVSLGYDDAEWMEQDPDLDALKQDPAFNALLRELKPES